jgi:hypothetical protein
MQAAISLDEVIESAVKYNGCVLTYNEKKVRDLKTLNPKSVYDTAYIPLQFKHVNGKLMPVKIKFTELLICSSAKAPQSSSEEGIPKHLNISFMKLKREDIAGGDYTPKQKPTPELQAAEDERVAGNISRYMENLEKFLKVLEIIDNSYKTVCAELISNEANLSFRIRKDRKMKDIPVFSRKQETRLNKDTNQDEKLENPIFRLQIPVYKKDGRIGNWSNYKNKFINTVFDARKMTKKNNYQAVPAKVKVGDKLVDLDVNNASAFITYKSLIGGSITFDSIVASKFGLSLDNCFYELYVYRHKAKASQVSTTKEDIIRMRGGESTESDDDEAEVSNEEAEDGEEDEGEEEEPEEKEE